jgi:hypothetical protein
MGGSEYRLAVEYGRGVFVLAKSLITATIACTKGTTVTLKNVADTDSSGRVGA